MWDFAGKYEIDNYKNKRYKKKSNGYGYILPSLSDSVPSNFLFFFQLFFMIYHKEKLKKIFDINIKYQKYLI